MRILMIAAVAATGFVSGASAHDDEATVKGNTIVVSCYRGPKTVVYWDRANPAFYDSLRAAGYSAATAHAIGDRVCRDQSLVDNLDAMKAEVARIIRTTRKDG